MNIIKPPRIFYGYYIVVAFIPILAVIHGFQFSYGVFFNQLLEEFQCSRAAISGAYSIGFLISGFSAIVLGRLSDRIGPRVILTVGGIIVGLGYFLMSQMNSLWQLYLFYSLIVCMWALPADVISLTTIARWFVKRRGFAGGLAKAGSGLGMMLIPILISYLINTQGWRTTYLIISIIIVVCVIPLSQFLRRDPSMKGLTPYGMEQGQTADSIKGGYSLQEALRTRQFWMLCIAMSTIQFVVNSLLVHITPHAIDLGVSISRGAQLISILGAVSIVGRISVPTFGDRIGLQRVLLGCFMLALIALLWLYFANEYWQLVVFVLVYGFSHGGFFSLMSPLLAEMFSTKALGSLFGILTFCGTLGGAVGPFVLGLIFDNTGSYKMGFLILIGIIIAGLSLVLFIRPVRKKQVLEIA